MNRTMLVTQPFFFFLGSNLELFWNWMETSWSVHPKFIHKSIINIQQSLSVMSTHNIYNLCIYLLSILWEPPRQLTFSTSSWKDQFTQVAAPTRRANTIQRQNVQYLAVLDFSNPTYTPPKMMIWKTQPNKSKALPAIPQNHSVCIAKVNKQAQAP